MYVNGQLKLSRKPFSNWVAHRKLPSPLYPKCQSILLRFSSFSTWISQLISDTSAHEMRAHLQQHNPRMRVHWTSLIVQQELIYLLPSMSVLESNELLAFMLIWPSKLRIMVDQPGAVAYILRWCSDRSFGIELPTVVSKLNHSGHLSQHQMDGGPKTPSKLNASAALGVNY